MPFQLLNQIQLYLFNLKTQINVNGDDAIPLYKYLKKEQGSLILGDSIKWNFTKFLVDKNGRVVDRFMPTTDPSSLKKKIEELL